MRAGFGDFLDPHLQYGLVTLERPMKAGRGGYPHEAQRIALESAEAMHQYRNSGAALRKPQSFFVETICSIALSSLNLAILLAPHIKLGVANAHLAEDLFHAGTQFSLLQGKSNLVCGELYSLHSMYSSALSSLHHAGNFYDRTGRKTGTGSKTRCSLYLSLNAGKCVNAP